MKTQRKVSAKTVIESSNWIITKIHQGYHGKVRIDAKTRFHVADGVNFFSEWVSKKYADRLTREHYGKKTNELNCFVY